MADYQLTATDVVIRAVDQACIPNDPDNRDRAEYDRWLDDGGVPDPYVEPPPPEPPPPPPDAVVAQMEYRAKTLTQQIIDPGNTFIIWNTVAQVDATKLTIAARDDTNIDQGNLFRLSSTVGRLLYIQYANNAAQVQRFEITGVIDNVTWFEMDVSPISAGGGPFVGNNPLYVLLGSPGAGGTSPGTGGGAYVTQQQFAELQAEVARIAQVQLAAGL